MTNVNSYKVVIDNVVPQIEVLQKAIELDPANIILYQRAIDFFETNISVSETIIKAIKLVEKDSKKTAEDSKKTEEKPKTSTKKKNLNQLQLLRLKKWKKKQTFLICSIKGGALWTY